MKSKTGNKHSICVASQTDRGTAPTTQIQSGARSKKATHRSVIPAVALAGCVLASFNAQASLVVDDAFRFIRTDSYAEAGGGAVIDNGSYTINGNTAPIGGNAALGHFVSTIENTASANSGSNSATGRALVEIDSLLEATADSLTFDITAHMETEADIAGDGLVAGIPRSNATRTFSFINQQVDFTIDNDYVFSMTGISSPYTLYNITLSEYVSGTTGTLSAGSYHFRAITHAEELYSGSIGNTLLERDFDVSFNLARAQVPTPGPLLLLLGTGLMLAGRG